MKTVTYSCDICRGTFDGGKERDLIGFEFNIGDSPLFRVVNIKDSARHVCPKCLSGLVSLQKEWHLAGAAK